MSLSERYEILDEWGRGASGVVYRARERQSGRLVAVKVLHAERGSERRDGARERLEREGALLARIRHPGVVRVLEVGVDNAAPFLVTEFVEGGSLAELLRERGRLEAAHAVSIVAQAARALDCVHEQGVVHRDVKPANLLIDREGAVKVTDFGVAGGPVADEAAPEESGYFCGTPAYVAPEQLRGETAGPAADVYSLGVVLFQALTGRRPFEARSVRELMHRVMAENAPRASLFAKDLPPALVELTAEALARDPSGRPASALAFARRLEEAQSPVRPSLPGSFSARAGGDAGDEALEATAVPLRRLALPREARRGLFAATLVVALLLVAGALPGLAPRDEDANTEPPAEGVEESRMLRSTLSAACREAPDDPDCTAAYLAALARDPADDEAFEALGQARPLEPLAPTVPRPEGEATDDAGPAKRAGDVGAVVEDGEIKTLLEPAPPLRPALLERYAGQAPRGPARATRRPPEPARRAAREPAASREAPQPAALQRAGAGASEPERLEQEAPARLILIVEHALEEGLLELRVEGRRVALRPLEAGAGRAALEVSLPPRTLTVEARVLSASARVDAGWTRELEPEPGVSLEQRLVLRGPEPEWTLRLDAW